MEHVEYNFKVFRFEDENISKFNSNNNDIGLIELINSDQIYALFK